MADGKKKAKKKGKKVGETIGKGKREDIHEGDIPKAGVEKRARVEAAGEQPGKSVDAEPAHVPETVVKVRGTAVGGTKVMSADEHAEYCEAEKKKAKK